VRSGLQSERRQAVKPFSKALRSRRRVLKLNTAEIAARLTAQGIACSPRTVEDWEQARRTPERFKQEAILQRL
jgi:DNA-binding transcriptional regulator YiaG